MQRRAFLRAGAGTVAGLLLPAGVTAEPVVEIRLVQDRASGRVAFDPVGLLLESGTRVRWVNEAGVHTITAYHPDNDNRPLRIPHDAEAWDSGYLVEPGSTFERRLTHPGVYDYCCRPHERAGMAGRLVVGTVTGPGARAFGWWRDDPGRDWKSVPRAVRQRLPAARAIRAAGRIRP